MGRIVAIALLLAAMVTVSFAAADDAKYSQLLKTNQVDSAVNPGSFDVNAFADGKKLYEEGKYKEAVASFDAATTQNPKDFNAFLWKGYALSQLGNDEDNVKAVISAFTSATGSDETKNAAYLGIAQKNLELAQKATDSTVAAGLYKDALASVDKINANNVEALMLKGEINYNLGENKEAAAAYAKATEIKPDNADAWKNLGIVLFASEDYAGSAAALTNATEKGIDLAPVWTMYGKALYKNGMKVVVDELSGSGVSDRNGLLNQAIAAFDKSVALDPNDFEAFYLKGQALAQLGKTSEAIAAYDNAKTVQPTNLDVWQSYGNALYQLGNYKDASAAFTTLGNLINDQVTNSTIVFPPADEKAWEDYVKVLKAENVADKAKEAYFVKGASDYLLGDYTGAVEALKITTKLDKANAPAWLVLADALKKNGKFDEAAAAEEELTKLGFVGKDEINAVNKALEDFKVTINKDVGDLKTANDAFKKEIQSLMNTPVKAETSTEEPVEKEVSAENTTPVE